jgi:formate-dependent nitrite reductase membrane component NrfD
MKKTIAVLIVIAALAGIACASPEALLAYQIQDTEQTLTKTTDVCKRFELQVKLFKLYLLAKDGAEAARVDAASRLTEAQCQAELDAEQHALDIAEIAAAARAGAYNGAQDRR